jgi:hypothetical protein
VPADTAGIKTNVHIVLIATSSARANHHHLIDVLALHRLATIHVSLPSDIIPTPCWSNLRLGQDRSKSPATCPNQLRKRAP